MGLRLLGLFHLWVIVIKCATMPCRLCIERGRPANFASDPQCGFDENGNFTTDNWMCATLLKLRELAGEGVLQYSLEEGQGTHYGAHWRAGDTSLSVIETRHPVAPEYVAWIVMSFYKTRGRTGQAWFFYENEPPRPVTIADAERSLANATVLTVHANSKTPNLLTS